MLICPLPPHNEQVWSEVSPAATADLPNSRAGYEITTSESRNPGGQSIKVNDGGAHQIITFTPSAISSSGGGGGGGGGGPGSTITFGGYSKAVHTGSGLWNDYSIYADVTYTDGTTLVGEAARFQGGTTNGWAYEAHSFTVPSDKSVASIDLHALYRNDPTDGGYVYFDDLFITTDASASLTNRGFEATTPKGAATGWSSYMGGYTVSTNESKSGSQAIAVKSGGAVQKLFPTNARAGRKLKFSGYAKSIGAAPIHYGPAVMSIYADIKFVDGTWLNGQEAEFAGGTTAGWEYAKNTITLQKDVETISLYAVYYGDSGAGVAYFDDIDLQIM